MTFIYSGDEEYGDEITSPSSEDEDWYGEAEHRADEARIRHYVERYGEEP